ncbi:MAG: (Na+)-NQR maturation NqrM [Pseudomonadota bacterium]|nr:(Na+)-NQR maturation NqrM [Pseudomonadota bacterium]
MTWFIVFIVMLLVVALMAIGVIAGRKPIAGSCGGIAHLGIEKECGICGNDFSQCKRRQAGQAD